MSQTRYAVKSHTVLFLICCAAIGLLFGFTIGHNWETLRTEELYPGTSAVSQPVFYIYCVVAYLLQGISFGIVSENPKKNFHEFGIILFWAQFLFFIVWLGLFFISKQYEIALVDAALSFVLTLISFNAFKRIDIYAAILLIPYALLQAFLTMMNLFILT